MWKSNYTLKIKILHLLIRISAIFSIIYAIYYSLYVWLFISLIIYWIMGTVGINITYHRLLSHRSFETHQITYYILNIIGTLTGMGSALSWVSVHRQHHRYSDTEKDPHSPHHLGIKKTFLGRWGNIDLSLRDCRDINKNNFLRFLHKNYFLINYFYILILGLIDLKLMFFAYFIPCFLIYYSATASNVISHIHGYRSYNTSDLSHNSWISNLITLGEGWHNNHHANPWKWKSGERWWEIDIPALLIMVIKK